MKVFVVTNPENGWNCVTGVYQAESKEQLKEYLLKAYDYDDEPEDWEDKNIIHEETLKKLTR